MSNTSSTTNFKRQFVKLQGRLLAIYAVAEARLEHADDTNPDDVPGERGFSSDVLDGCRDTWASLFKADIQPDKPTARPFAHFTQHVRQLASTKGMSLKDAANAVLRAAKDWADVTTRSFRLTLDTYPN